MKRFFLILSALTICISLFSQEAMQPKKYSIFLTGASFAVPVNGWFELGCKTLNAEPINRAIGGEAIANTANRMADSTLYTPEELEKMDAFVIMQVHNRDVFDELMLKDKYTDYETPFDRSNYAAAFDYVIKRYLTECYNLKFNEKSKYYGSPCGKPAVIVLCTDWHDGRTLYNATIRKLAAKWGFPLVEFDKNIGFSKNQLNPVTGEQMSRMYALDKQVLYDETYGWHPIQGQDKYIQRRMAAIFVDVMKRILPL